MKEEERSLLEMAVALKQTTDKLVETFPESTRKYLEEERQYVQLEDWIEKKRRNY